MSAQRYVKTEEQKAREKKIKRMTGYEADTCFCTLCKKQFTDREVDNDEVLVSIGRFGRMLMHDACYRKEYFGE